LARIAHLESHVAQSVHTPASTQEAAAEKVQMQETISHLEKVVQDLVGRLVKMEERVEQLQGSAQA
jgi:hypothetical protein